MEKPSQIFYGALALLIVAGIGAAMAAAGAEGAAFGLFTALTLGGSMVCIWEKSVVRSAFALMATFTGVAGFFVLLHADYLAMAQLLIYVGGILALILFGVMLTPPDLTERKLPRVLSGLFMIGAAFAWVGYRVASTAEWATRSGTVYGAEAGNVDNSKRIGVAFLAADQYVVAFELAAVLLTVALVAAVYIARRKRADLEPEAGEL